jgi:hypothetical protein
MSISDPPQAGQAGWHGGSLFLIFASIVFPVALLSSANFMGSDLHFDARSIERLASIQLPSPMM